MRAHGGIAGELGEGTFAADQLVAAGRIEPGEQRGSSTRIARVLLLPDAPSIDGNEITDKGYINQRLALERRKADVARVFAPTPDPDVIVVTQS